VSAIGPGIKGQTVSGPPEVTVVIPTHDRCDLLKETLSSLQAQSFSHWETVVVDDASADGTWSWLSGLNDGRVRPIRLDEHSERSKARNVGLATARGRYVLFLDDDDLLPPTALEVHLKALRRHPEAIASIGGYVLFSAPGLRRRVRLVRRAAVRAIHDDVLFGWTAVSGQCLFPTELVRSLNGWNESARITVIEDHELWLRAARLGPVALLPETVLEYRVHAGQWRPQGLAQLLTEMRQEAAAVLEGRERAHAFRALRARALARAASKEYDAGHPASALITHLKVLRALPNLALSSLTRGSVLLPPLKCLGVMVGLRRGRALVAHLRRMIS